MNRKEMRNKDNLRQRYKFEIRFPDYIMKSSIEVTYRLRWRIALNARPSLQVWEKS